MSGNQDQSVRLFAEDLSSYGDNIAVIHDDNVAVTYQQLDRLVDEFAEQLPVEKSLVIVETANELEPLVVYLACLKFHHPVILLELGASEKDNRVMKQFEPDCLFTKKGGRWHLEHVATAIERSLHQDLCVLLSTSGSTGDPKLVRLSVENIQANTDSICEYLSITSTDRAMTSLSIHYSFGMSVINTHLNRGAAVVLTESSVSHETFWQLFETTSANSLSLVPHQFELLEKVDIRAKSLPNLRYIAQAGGRLSQELAISYCSWLQKTGASLFVMYGQTEASPRMAYLPPELLVENSDCIGVPVPGGKLSVVDDSDVEITKANETGQLKYQGPNVMMGYARNQQELAADKSVYSLYTGDLAQINDNGLFKIVGRSSRFSKIFGLRISLDELEKYLLTQGIKTIITANDDLIVVSTTESDVVGKIQDALLTKYKIPLVAVQIITLEDYPTLSSGKYDYKTILSLGLEANQQAPRHTSLLQAYQSILGMEDIQPSDSFIDLGGDSLFFVIVSLEVEEQLGFLPDNWEALSIKKLEELKQQNTTDSNTTPVAKAWRIIAMVLLAWLVAEAFLQVRSHIKTGRSVANLLTGQDTFYHNPEFDLKTYRPNLEQVDGKGKVIFEVNSLGFRSPEITSKKQPGEFRIAVVGASTVMGMYAQSNAQTFPSILQTRLQQMFAENPIEVINTGVEGYLVRDLVKVTDRVLTPLAPDLIFVYPGFNDFSTLCRNQSSLQRQSLPILHLPNWLMTAQMIEKNTTYLRHTEVAKSDALDAANVDLGGVIGNLKQVVQKAQDIGAHPVLVTMARSYQNVAPSEQQKFAQTALHYIPCLDIDGLLSLSTRYNHAIRHLASSLGVDVVDLAQVMPGGDEYFVDANHFNFAGEKYVAGELESYLIKYMGGK